MTVALPAAGTDVDRYRRDLEALGEGGQEPSWLGARRRAAFERFKAHGFPTTRDEAWRQTSVARIAGTAFSRPDAGGRADAVVKAAGLLDLGGPVAVFVDGRFSSTLSTGDGTAGVEVTSLREMLQEAPSRLEPLWNLPAGETTSAFGDLNAALHDDGAVVFLAPGTIAPKPLHLVFLSTHGNVGSLEVGKLADVVVWNGDPLETTSWPLNVFIGGVEQPQDSRQTQLRDRYAATDQSGYPPAYR